MCKAPPFRHVPPTACCNSLVSVPTSIRKGSAEVALFVRDGMAGCFFVRVHRDLHPQRPVRRSSLNPPDVAAPGLESDSLLTAILLWTWVMRPVIGFGHRLRHADSSGELDDVRQFGLSDSRTFQPVDECGATIFQLGQLRVDLVQLLLQCSFAHLLLASIGWPPAEQVGVNDLVDRWAQVMAHRSTEPSRP